MFNPITYLNQLTVKEAFHICGKAFTIASGIFAVFWFVGKPFVDSYIKDVAAEEKYATQEQLNEIQKSVESIQKVIPVLENEFDALRDEQQRQTIISDQTRDLAREARRGIRELNADVKSLLRDFRSVNNIAPYANPMLAVPGMDVGAPPPEEFQN